MKRALFFFCCMVIALCAAACGNQTNGTTIPSIQEMNDNLSRAEYDVTEYTYISINGSEIAVDRLVAKKGSAFLDVCFYTTDTDGDTIYNYYDSTYQYHKLVEMSDSKVVFCLSDNTVMKDAGINIVEVNVKTNVKVKTGVKVETYVTVKP